MLDVTSGQLIVFLLCFCVGCGVTFCILIGRLALQKCNKNWVKQVVSVFAGVFICLGLVSATVIFNYGVIRFFVVFAYLFGLLGFWWLWDKISNVIRKKEKLH